MVKMLRTVLLLVLLITLSVSVRGAGLFNCLQSSALFNSASGQYWYVESAQGEGSGFFLGLAPNLENYDNYATQTFYRTGAGDHTYYIQSTSLNGKYLVERGAYDSLQFTSTSSTAWNISQKADGLLNIGSANGLGYICFELFYGEFVPTLSQGTGSHCSWDEICCGADGCTR